MHLLLYHSDVSNQASTNGHIGFDKHGHIKAVLVIGKSVLQFNIEISRLVGMIVQHSLVYLTRGTVKNIPTQVNMGHRVDVIIRTSGIVIHGVVQIHGIVARSRPAHVVFNGCNFVGIGMKQGIKCRILRSTWPASGAGEPFGQQHSVGLGLQANGESSQ